METLSESAIEHEFQARLDAAKKGDLSWVPEGAEREYAKQLADYYFENDGKGRAKNELQTGIGPFNRENIRADLGISPNNNPQMDLVGASSKEFREAYSKEQSRLTPLPPEADGFLERAGGVLGDVGAYALQLAAARQVPGLRGQGAPGEMMRMGAVEGLKEGTPEAAIHGAAVGGALGVGSEIGAAVGGQLGAVAGAGAGGGAITAAQGGTREDVAVMMLLPFITHGMRKAGTAIYREATRGSRERSKAAEDFVDSLSPFENERPKQPPAKMSKEELFTEDGGFRAAQMLGIENIDRIIAKGTPSRKDLAALTDERLSTADRRIIAQNLKDTFERERAAVNAARAAANEGTLLAKAEVMADILGKDPTIQRTESNTFVPETSSAEQAMRGTSKTIVPTPEQRARFTANQPSQSSQKPTKQPWEMPRDEYVDQVRKGLLTEESNRIQIENQIAKKVRLVSSEDFSKISDSHATFEKSVVQPLMSDGVISDIDAGALRAIFSASKFKRGGSFISPNIKTTSQERLVFQEKDVGGTKEYRKSITSPTGEIEASGVYWPAGTKFGNPDTGWIELSRSKTKPDSTSLGVLIHELGHHFFEHAYSVGDAAADFARLVKTGDVSKYLSEKLGGKYAESKREVWKSDVDEAFADTFRAVLSERTLPKGKIGAAVKKVTDSIVRLAKIALKRPDVNPAIKRRIEHIVEYLAGIKQTYKFDERGGVVNPSPGYYSQAAKAARKAAGTKQGLVSAERDPLSEHRRIIEGALSRGERVPPEVLKDYPDLLGQPQPVYLERPLGSDAMGAIQIDSMARKARQGINIARTFLKKYFTSEGYMPKDAHKQRVLRDGWLASQMKEIAFTLRDFKKAAKKDFGSKNMTLEQTKRVNAVLQNQMPAEFLPENVRVELKKARNQIDALSRKLIDEGIVEGDLALIIEQHEGVYTTRTHRVFDDPKWAEKVPEEIRNKFKALVRKEQPELTENQIEGQIAHLLFEGKAADTPVARMAQMKNAKDTSILKRRVLESPEIRALYGEHFEPMVNYTRSVMRMSQLIANHRLLTEMRDLGMKQGWLYEKPEVNETGEYKVRVASKGSETMSPLDGLFTTPEIRDAIRGLSEGTNNPEWLQYYMRVNGIVKYSKTVGSPMTHVRNLIGNAGFAVANGHYRIGKSNEARKAIAASLGLSNDPVYREYFRRLQRLGVVTDEARAGELKDVLNDALKGDIDSWMYSTADKYTKRVMKGAADVAVELYRAEDDVWKVFAFENERARYKKAMPGLSDAELDTIAADIVRKTYPTYSQIPEGIKKLRRFPLLGTFVSFPSEILRVGYGTIRQALTELADPRTRAIGMERMVGITSATFGISAAAAASRFLFGVSADDDEDLRRFVAPWSENSQIVHFGKNEDGEFTWVDMSYTDPWSYLKTSAMAAWRGEDWESRLIDSVKEFFAAFLSEEILAQHAMDVFRNTKKSSGGPVYNPQESAEKQAADVAEHIWEAMEPGFISSSRRIYRGLGGYVSPYGKTYDPKIEAMAVAAGHRIQKTDPLESLRQFKARKFNDDIRQAAISVTQTARSKGIVSDAELADAYKETNESRRRLFDEMHKTVRAAINLGATEKEAYNALRAANISKENAAQIMRGVYRPYQPTKYLLQSMKDATGSTDRGRKLVSLYREARSEDR